MQALTPPGEPAELEIADEVTAILAEHFPDGVASPTEAAIARGRAKVIIRDAANDDEPVAG